MNDVIEITTGDIEQTITIVLLIVILFYVRKIYRRLEQPWQPPSGKARGGGVGQ
jgi:hypothetical protein